MDLEIRKYTNEELAQWFNIKCQTFKNTKRKRLEELTEYCEFIEDNNGKIIVTKVYKPKYVKKKSKSYRIAVDNLDEHWDKSGYDTVKRVSNEIYCIFRDNIKIKETSFYLYSLEARNELYGKPYGEEGILGSCIYEWCNKDDNGHVAPLTEEERKIFDECLQKYFGNASEKFIAILTDEKSGELNEAECWRELKSLMNPENKFKDFLQELREYDIFLVKGTKIQKKEKSIWEED